MQINELYSSGVYLCALQHIHTYKRIVRAAHPHTHTCICRHFSATIALSLASCLASSPSVRCCLCLYLRLCHFGLTSMVFYGLPVFYCSNTQMPFVCNMPLHACMCVCVCVRVRLYIRIYL